MNAVESRTTTYRFNGRYMQGSEVMYYNVIDGDGRSYSIDKAQTLAMIRDGLIENLRLQYTDNGPIIRGKGINMLDYPVWDLKKLEIRGTSESKPVKSGVNPLSKLELTRRVMYKTNCIGYMVKDASGRESTKPLPYKKVVDLALRGFITNAEAQKYTPRDGSGPKIVLRGIGDSLKNLKTVVVDQNGNIIDTTKSGQEVTVRTTRMRKGGIVYDLERSSKMVFEPGDYLVCTVTGGLTVIKSESAEGHISKSEKSSAICDNYLSSLSKYSIELFGKPRQTLTPNVVLRWPIVTIKK